MDKVDHPEVFKEGDDGEKTSEGGPIVTPNVGGTRWALSWSNKGAE